MATVKHTRIAKTAMPRTGRTLDAVNSVSGYTSNKYSEENSGGVSDHGDLRGLVNSSDSYLSENYIHLTPGKLQEINKAIVDGGKITYANGYLLYESKKIKSEFADDFPDEIKKKKKFSSVEIIENIVKKCISSETFISGLFGEGFKIYDSNGWNLEIDNLTVRKVMNVFEMVIQKIRSVGGSLVISQANGKISNVSDAGTHYKLDFEINPLFSVNDLIRCKSVSGVTNKDYWIKVDSVEYGSIKVLKSDFLNASPEIGDELIQMGNTSDASRQSLICLSTNEGKPVIDIYEGVNNKSFEGKLKTRLGALNGITDSDFPSDNQPEGYGIYSANAYFKGVFVMANGKTVEEEFSKTIKTFANFENDPPTPERDDVNAGDIWTPYKNFQEEMVGITYTYSVTPTTEGWVPTGDNTSTVIQKGLITTGSILFKGENGEIKGGITGAGTMDQSIRQWYGDEIKENAPYRVNQAGEFWATKAHITGEVNASSGRIGGFYIEGDGLHADPDKCPIILTGKPGNDCLIGSIGYGYNSSFSVESIQYIGRTAINIYVGDSKCKGINIEGNGTAIDSLGSCKFITRNTSETITIGFNSSVGDSTNAIKFQNIKRVKNGVVDNYTGFVFISVINGVQHLCCQ